MSSCSLSPSLFMVASITRAPISTVMPSSASRLTPSSLWNFRLGQFPQPREPSALSSTNCHGLICANTKGWK